MPAAAKNRVLQVVTGNPGTGAVTLGAAVSGYQAFGAADNGNLFTVTTFGVDSSGNPNGLWEVQVLSQYNSATATLSRTAANVEDGSSGPGVLVKFNSGAQRVVQGNSAALFPNHIVSVGEVVPSASSSLSSSSSSASKSSFGPPSVTFNLAQGDKQASTLVANANLILQNDVDGQEFTIFLIQGGSGNNLATWWSGITWQSGALPALQTAIGAIDVFKFTRQAAGSYFGRQLNTAPQPVQSIPICTTTQSLTTSLAPIGNRFRLLSTDWDLGPGRTPQYRINCSFDSGGGQISTGDILEIDVFDPVASATIASATVTAPNQGANNVYLAQTAWINVPTSIVYPYCEVRNQTGARGNASIVWMEIRYR